MVGGKKRCCFAASCDILYCDNALSDVLSRQKASQIPVPSNTDQKETWRSTIRRAMFPYFILYMLCSAMIPVPFFLPRRFFFHGGMEAWDRFYLSSFTAPCRLSEGTPDFAPGFSYCSCLLRPSRRHSVPDRMPCSNTSSR